MSLYYIVKISVFNNIVLEGSGGNIIMIIMLLLFVWFKCGIVGELIFDFVVLIWFMFLL